MLIEFSLIYDTLLQHVRFEFKFLAHIHIIKRSNIFLKNLFLKKGEKIRFFLLHLNFNFNNN